MVPVYARRAAAGTRGAERGAQNAPGERSMLVRLQPANRWKHRDAKPEATAPRDFARTPCGATLVRPPDTLHPNNSAKKG